MEEIDRLEGMAGMEELRGLASKIRAGRVPFLARQAQAAGKAPSFDVGDLWAVNSAWR